jgi:hypothetical protein
MESCGQVGIFLKGEVGANRGRKIFFFPCFARPGEEEDPQCRQNSFISVFFFFTNSA